MVRSPILRERGPSLLLNLFAILLKGRRDYGTEANGFSEDALIP